MHGVHVYGCFSLHTQGDTPVSPDASPKLPLRNHLLLHNAIVGVAPPLPAIAVKGLRGPVLAVFLVDPHQRE